MSNSTDATRRTALVTGAATGIGLATCRALAADGWRLFATAMPGQDAQRLHEVEHVEVIEVDLTDAPSREHLIAAVSTAARLDALVSNAGLAVPGPVEAITADQLRLQFELNSIVPVLLAQAFLPRLRASRGRMVFVGAGQGRVALPFGGPYGASKSGLAALTDALRAEVSGSGVAISLIEPGAVRTDILTESRTRAMALLDQLPAETAARYRKPLLTTFARSERAFERAIPPDEVARLITRILDARKPKPRYLIGREAVALAVVAVLPARWRARLTRRLMR